MVGSIGGGLNDGDGGGGCSLVGGIEGVTGVVTSGGGGMDGVFNGGGDG